MSKLQKKPSALKRGHPTLQNMNFYKFLSTFVGPFCPPGSGSGFRIRIHRPDGIRIQSGSGSTTLAKTDPASSRCGFFQRQPKKNLISTGFYLLNAVSNGTGPKQYRIGTDLPVSEVHPPRVRTRSARSEARQWDHQNARRRWADTCSRTGAGCGAAS